MSNPFKSATKALKSAVSLSPIDMLSGGKVSKTLFGTSARKRQLEGQTINKDTMSEEARLLAQARSSLLSGRYGQDYGVLDPYSGRLKHKSLWEGLNLPDQTRNFATTPVIR